MTADQVFTNVLTLIFSDESEKPDYEEAFLSLLNMRLADTFEENNSIREAKGKERLTEIPEITTLEEELPYEEELLRSIIPLGIAADLYAEEDAYICEGYRIRYEKMLQKEGRAAFREAEE